MNVGTHSNKKNLDTVLEGLPSCSKAQTHPSRTRCPSHQTRLCTRSMFCCGTPLCHCSDVERPW